MSKALPSHSEEVRMMLQRAVQSLRPEARDLVADFIAGEFDAQRGGFVGRDKLPDIYYSSFGLSCAEAIGMKERISLRALMRYVTSFQVETFDLIHQACWAKLLVQLIPLSLRCRCFALRQFQLLFLQAQAKRLLRSMPLEAQSDDPYMIFLAINLLQDVGVEIPAEFQTSALALLSQPSQQSGVLSKTVSAILARRQLCGTLDTEALAWLKQQQTEQGGFRASVQTGVADMLSTAVALFTLRICGDLDKETACKAKQFMIDHWLSNGGFASVIEEDVSDCEYTFYGLLGLGAIAA